ncbi:MULTISPECIES: CDP-alcohol phosphatidyltransferase family protein [unclassified Schaalia]|uniref:CDP-alcohol phosphatidyltransferase family protein n=1 Tax=unclassified Schaalia TaxID=2691889 RepID=UPI001E56FEB4|nr:MULTISPECIES: CDP-alcohol phosphatidyltransferase family protein [unclassified Schaalia]MCD4549348.1 phosphatidylcholine synthase [Schaalia sp. lx-260]MCD4557156.1 phosphatidylcholine synthase [Schaalia sp. lx-100]
MTEGKKHKDYTELSKGQCFARKCAAWGVHAFTMTGVMWAGLAMLALVHESPSLMWMWLAVALIVDGIDGTLARRADVTRWAPHFDGKALDLIVDYLTWTFIPAAFMYLHIPLGPPWAAMLIFVLICTSSMFCYCNTAMKTHDFYFMGFPAAWNVVAIIMWIMHTGPVINIIFCVVLAILTLMPITFVHPFRVGTLMPVNIVAAVLWVGGTIYLISTYPQRPTLVHILWWVGGIWLMLISAWRSTREFIHYRKDVRDDVPA